MLVSTRVNGTLLRSQSGLASKQNMLFCSGNKITHVAYSILLACVVSEHLDSVHSLTFYIGIFNIKHFGNACVSMTKFAGAEGLNAVVKLTKTV